MCRIANAISNIESSTSLEGALREALGNGVPPVDILEKGLRKGLQQLGAKYEAGEYFLSELLYGASMIDQAMKLIGPSLKAEKLGTRGLIVLGTVRGDIHDIGKNIFRLIAEASGFEVDDLGVDVPPERFLEKIVQKMPAVLGLSSLLTTTMPEMKRTVGALRKAGVRDKVKVLLGGNSVTEVFGEEVGADAVALDAVQGVDLCRGWVGE